MTRAAAILALLLLAACAGSPAGMAYGALRLVAGALTDITTTEEGR